MVGIDTLGAVGCSNLDITAVGAFICDIPSAVIAGIKDTHSVLGITVRTKGFKHKLLIYLGRYPRCSDVDADFTRTQIFGLHRLQSRNTMLDFCSFFGR